jgi:hypothetical protein
VLHLFMCPPHTVLAKSNAPASKGVMGENLLPQNNITSSFHSAPTHLLARTSAQ